MESMGIQFGLMQYLGRMSGDNPLLMMVLTGLLIPLTQQGPMIMHWIMKQLAQYLRYVPKNSARRVIEFTEGTNMDVRPDQGPLVREETSTERNNILQKAIRLYISKDKDKLSITDAEVYLLAAATGESDDGVSSPAYMYGRCHPRVKNFGDVDAGLKKLMGYSVTKGPREGKWLEVDRARHISFKFYCSKSVIAEPDDFDDGGFGKGKGRKGGGGGGGGGGPQSKRTTTFELMCEGKDAEQVLDSYIEEALEYYKSLRSAAVDRSRYFFMPDYAPNASHDDDYMPYGKGGGRGGCVYKKYVLSEHKTFNSLFFPEKAQVIEMLDDFLQGRGKFAIEGFPNKLGLLLHGPPGTGKTSLIKSIASYTKRHIVEVPITKVKTNKMLFDSMFDLVFKCPGEDEALRMKFSDVVFVMEDVDAASSIVYSRTQQKTGKKKKRAPGKGKGKGRGATGKDVLQGEMPGQGERPRDRGVAVPPLETLGKGGKGKGKASPDMVGKGGKDGSNGDTTEEAPPPQHAATAKGVEVVPDVLVAAAAATTSGSQATVGSASPQPLALPGASASPPLPPASCLPLVRSSSLPDYRTLASAAMLERSSMRRLVRTITVGSTAAEKEEAPAAGKTQITEEVENEEEDDDDDDEEEEEEEKKEGEEPIFGRGPWAIGNSNSAASKKKGKFTLDPDALNLSGLLNVLDGVVDSPGRILVMTTNHPEKLDAALIRPGRINFAIELGFMQAEQLCHLVQHLIRGEEITEEQRRAAGAIASEGRITPAKVEQSCAEVSTIDGLLEKLRLIESATAAAPTATAAGANGGGGGGGGGAALPGVARW